MGTPAQITSRVRSIPGAKAGLAGLADDLPLLDRIADLDVDGTQVAVKRKQPQAMIEDDGIAVNAQVADEGDRAAVGGLDRIMLGNGQVVAEVIGGIDRFVVVSVGP